MILAGDIGGTKSNLSLFEIEGETTGREVRSETLLSAAFTSFETLVAAFVREDESIITHACIGIAGPVVNDEVRATNLAWMVGKAGLAQVLPSARISLINDLEATAYSIELLREDQLVTLNAGIPEPEGNRALVAAGTGLGTGALFHHGDHYYPVPSEGGHVDFPARTEMEIELLRYLTAKYGGHVSCERVLSGPGLYNIYRFFRDVKRVTEPGWLSAQISAGDPAEVISKAALERGDDLAGAALDLFVSVYGAVAGNVALLMKATGGLYLCGGIAPKIIAALCTPDFLAAFQAKGRMSAFVSRIPVRVIMEERAAVVGAARRALMTGS